jgi:hypothetical protein
VIGSSRLEGLTVVVTGGHAGVGLETARALSAAAAMEIASPVT